MGCPHSKDSDSDTKKMLDAIKGPCPDSHPLFLPWNNEENKYYCYRSLQSVMIKAEKDFKVQAVPCLKRKRHY